MRDFDQKLLLPSFSFNFARKKMTREHDKNGSFILEIKIIRNNLASHCMDSRNKVTETSSCKQLMFYLLHYYL